MRYLGIIPARAGSKGIPNKNMQLIGKKPMLQYTLEAAKFSDKINLAVLSSNDENCISLSRHIGVRVPFIRPEELSADSSTLKDVVTHVINWHKAEYNDLPSNLVLLQPTSPFRTAEDIDRAIEHYESLKCKSLIAVCEVMQHPADCIYADGQKKISEVMKKEKNGAEGRWGFKKVYFISGALYITSTERFLDTLTFYDSESETFLLPQSHSFDIDEPYDLELARAMVSYSENINAEIFNM